MSVSLNEALFRPLPLLDAIVSVRLLTFGLVVTYSQCNFFYKVIKNGSLVLAVFQCVTCSSIEYTMVSQINFNIYMHKKLSLYSCITVINLSFE